MNEDLSVKILSDITVHSKYAKFLPNKQRRETWDEICDRYQTMMVQRYPHMEDDIVDAMKFVREKKVLPSMRALQFAGPAIESNESRIYNCAYLPIDSIYSFSETMFLLLGGTGVGYSVQTHHIQCLPMVKKPWAQRDYFIEDSIEGWADSIKALLEAYTGINTVKPVFKFDKIRPKGARLITAGGQAPGPEPLKECLEILEKILEAKEDGSNISSLEAHDMLCHIANAVLAGGIRRSAMISLFSQDDEAMLTCKSGNWWESNEQRGRANNSIVLERNKVTQKEFLDIWKKIEESNAGEPGVYWTNNKDWGTNPCCEIALRPYQFCNLTEINAHGVVDQYDFDCRALAAAFFGTLQAGFTNFHYLRPIWKQTTEEDALIGVGITGIGSGDLANIDLKEAVRVVRNENKEVAELIGINIAARTTTIKPAGTTSCVLGCSSGIHAWHNDYYIRRIRVGKNEALYTYLLINHPELLEDDHFRPDKQAVISIPQKAPKTAMLRTETAMTLLDRVERFNIGWVKEGHRSGANTNNVSATISINKENLYRGDKLMVNSEGGRMLGGLINEWETVGEWMWKNKNIYNGLSVLPYDNGSYVQAPFEDCTKERYEELMKALKEIDLTKVIEIEDNVNHGQEAACAGGTCSI